MCTGLRMVEPRRGPARLERGLLPPLVRLRFDWVAEVRLGLECLSEPALRGRIPRVLKNHRTADGVAVGAYMRALTRRLAVDPGNGAVKATLRQAGLTQLDLMKKRAELDAVRTKLNRKRRERQLERDVLRLVKTAVGLERHLASYASDWQRHQLEADAHRARRRAAPATAR